jgi:hypothetical protein
LRYVKVHAVDLRAGRRTGNVSRGRIPASSEPGMLEQFPPQPDDTVELAAVPAHRPIALIVSAAVVAIGVLIGVGFLAFGGLGGSGGGIRSPGLLPAISAEPDTSAPPATPSTPPTTATPAATPVKQTPTPTGTPTTPHAVAVSITNATMKPPTYTGPDCPGSTTGVATVTATGPVTITYRWVSTAIAPPASGTVSFRFGAAGSHQFSRAFANIMTPNGQVAAAFVVVTPVFRRASMTYTQKCGASASNITRAASKSPCSVTFVSTIHAGVGPMTVNYHWRFSGPGPGPVSEIWSFPVGGGTHKVTSGPFTISKGSTVTAALVLDTPVRFVTGTVTATCP